jgi:hypothetical protein
MYELHWCTKDIFTTICHQSSSLMHDHRNAMKILTDSAPIARIL